MHTVMRKSNYKLSMTGYEQVYSQIIVKTVVDNILYRNDHWHIIDISSYKYTKYLNIYTNTR